MHHLAVCHVHPALLASVHQRPLRTLGTTETGARTATVLHTVQDHPQTLDPVYLRILNMDILILGEPEIHVSQGELEIHDHHHAQEHPLSTLGSW